MPEALRTMVSGLTAELILAILVVLCGACLLAGAVWLLGRSGGAQRRPNGEEGAGAGRDERA